METLLILILIAINCSIVGQLLFQRQLMMVADTLSHTILLGIVISYLIVKDLNSPFLIFGATAMGIMTSILIDLFIKKTNLKQDAAINIVYSALFATAILIVTKFLDNVHLDTDIVLLGEIIFAPLTRMDFFHMNLPVALVHNAWLLVGLLFCLILNFKALKTRLFDQTFSITVGIPVSLIDFLTMVFTAFVCVLSFQNVGAILVVSMMAAPALTSQLFAKHFYQSFIIGAFVAVINSCIGYLSARHLNVSVSGMMTFIGLLTLLVAITVKKIRKSFINYL